MTRMTIPDDTIRTGRPSIRAGALAIRAGALALRAGALSVLLTFAVAGSAVAATSAPTDAWITTKVKISLATADDVSARDVNVDTIAGQVTLHGKVNSASEKDAAERTAKSIDGVKNVRNLLQVVSTAREEKVEAKDDEIQKKVSDALDKEPSLEGSSISVHSVNKGVVLLKGSAEDMSDHLTAVRVTRSVPGVRQVASEVQAPDEVADEKIWREPKGGVSGAAGDAKSATKDLYITSMVKMKLLAESKTPAMDINVDTNDGVVTLFGMVPSAESKAVAESEARETAGVVSVNNQLQVIATAKQPEVQANDEVAEDALRKNMKQYSELDQIDVEVKNCVARLSGTVPSGIERVEALQLARATTGVCSVKDNLTIQ